MRIDLRKEKGITLVALIITIVILIILAAVTINAVIHDGFIGVAINGTQNYAKEQYREVDEVSKLADKLNDAIDKINGGGNDETGEITAEKLKMQIGKYVNYKPTSGEYPKSTLDTYSGSTNNEKFTTDESLRWRIWNVTDDTLYLISDKSPTTGGVNNGKLELVGALGYNNGVTLLDEMCEACYTNNDYEGIKVQNLKVEDIADVWSEKDREFLKNNIDTREIKLDVYPTVWYENERDVEQWLINKSKTYPLTTSKLETATATSLYGVGDRIYRENINWNSDEYLSLLYVDDECFWLSTRFFGRTSYRTHGYGAPPGEGLSFGLFRVDGSESYYVFSPGSKWHDDAKSRDEIEYLGEGFLVEPSYEAGLIVQEEGALYIGYGITRLSEKTRPIVSIPLSSANITKAGAEDTNIDYLINSK